MTLNEKKKKENTEEYKQTNTKKIKVNGKNKLLLMDDEEEKNRLENFVEAFVKQALEELFVQKANLVTESLIDEANYPENFKINEFISLSSFKKRIEYAKAHLGKYIGKGTSRIVFAADKHTVVKIAINERGLLQNKAEAMIAKNEPKIIAQILAADKSYSYLEVERAKSATDDDWKKLTGFSFADWSATLRNHMIDLTNSSSFKVRAPDNFEEIEDTDLFDETVHFIIDNDMPTGDLIRISSWGVVNRHGKNIPVIIDYGMTNSNAHLVMA